MMHCNKICAGLLVIIVIIKGGFTEELSHYGYEFYTGFPRLRGTNIVLSFLIHTEATEPVYVYVTITTLTGYSYTQIITGANNPISITIPTDFQTREIDFNYRNLGILITSKPFSISVIALGYDGTYPPHMSFLMHPYYEQPTKEYVYFGISSNSSLANVCSQILLVGNRNYTTVMISPTQTILLPLDPQLSNTTKKNVTKGESHIVMLHALQTLLISVSNSLDLTGTKIVSNYPLTVIGAHECGQEPEGYECDTLATQVPPTINWGTRYLLLLSGQGFKAIASEANTSVIITCNTINITQVVLSSVGDMYSFFANYTQLCDTTCNQRCYIAQFGLSRDHLGSYPNGNLFAMTIPSISQYPHSVNFKPIHYGNMTTSYSIVVPANNYFNNSILINNILTNLSWSPIYNSTGFVTGYGYSSNISTSSTVNIKHSHPNGSLLVTVYGIFTAGGYGYLAGISLKPKLPIIYFSSNNYIVCEGVSKELMIVVQRLTDLSLSLIIQISSSNLVNTLEFLPWETEKTVNFTLFNAFLLMNKTITLVAKAVASNVTFILDTTIISLQYNEEITIGFKDPVLYLNRDDILTLQVLLHGNLTQCREHFVTCVLLQLQDPEGMIINITHLEFNKYVREHSVGIDLNQIPLLLNFDSDGILLMATLVLESSTIDMTIEQVNVMIYYAHFIATTTLDVGLFTTSLTEQTSNTPTFLSSTTTVDAIFSSSIAVDNIFLSSTLVDPTLELFTIVDTIFSSSTILQPTLSLSTIVDTTFSSSTTVDIIHIISAVPTQTNHIILKTEIAYIIGGSTTVVVIIVCCFIIVISFCCGRCNPWKAQRQNTTNGQDRHVTTRPYVLTTDTNTSSDIEMKATNLNNLDNPDNPDEMNIYSLPDEERNNIYALPDVSDRHRLLSSSSRRPAPPPPHHSSRPLPPTPSSKLE